MKTAFCSQRHPDWCFRQEVSSKLSAVSFINDKIPHGKGGMTKQLAAQQKLAQNSIIEYLISI